MSEHVLMGYCKKCGIPVTDDGPNCDCDDHAFCNHCGEEIPPEEDNDGYCAECLERSL